MIHSVTLAVMAEAARISSVDEKPKVVISIPNPKSYLTLEMVRKMKEQMLKSMGTPHTFYEDQIRQITVSLASLGSQFNNSDLGPLLYSEPKPSNKGAAPFAKFAKDPKKNHRKKSHR